MVRFQRVRDFASVIFYSRDSVCEAVTYNNTDAEGCSTLTMLQINLD